MGAVYRAHDPSLHRDVAVKILPSQWSRDPERRARFLREARSAAAISHANIAVVHEVGEADGHVFIAMELVDGETLRARMAKGLDVPAALRLTTEIARGLVRAHEKGVVHRDLKPENVMITRHGEVKILDFGLAKVREGGVQTPSALGHAVTEAKTRDGRILGTPAYMSPEQARGTETDARTDVFALGVMFYEMLTGARPFVGQTTQDVVTAILRDVPRSPSERERSVPEELDRFVARCLEKDPAKRFGSMSDVVAALELAARADSKVVRGAAPAPKRIPWIIARAAVAVIAGVGMLYVLGEAAPSRVGPVVREPPSTNSVAPLATTITDLPPPPTKIPEAASEYAAGMRAYRDNNWFRMYEHFENVTKLDPTMAAGYFRLSMANLPKSSEAKRAAFGKAILLRDQLTARDQALLNALEPVLQRAQEDSGEAIRRIEALTKTYPLDVELWDWLGNLRVFDPAGLEPSLRAIELDDKDGNGWQNKAISLAMLGRTDEAHAAFEQCAAIAVDSADCVAMGATMSAIQGRCEDFEREARTAADRAPPYLVGVLQAMVSAHAQEASIREVRNRLVADAGPDAALVAAVMDVQFALVAGDFERVRALASKEAAALAANPTARGEYPWNYQIAMQAVTAALESGDDARARSLAAAFVSRSASFPRVDSMSHGVDRFPFLLRLASAPSAFEAERASWIRTRSALGAVQGYIRPYAYAGVAFTVDDARAALAERSKLAPALWVPAMGAAVLAMDTGLPDEDIGRVYLLTGDVEEALPHLRRAAASCGLWGAPAEIMHATLGVGEALEQKKDNAGACDAYSKILAQWGAAKPRSVTADEARKRAKALGCGR
jgi:eukaryotic-like serine/threonine-protein kinase